MLMIMNKRHSQNIKQSQIKLGSEIKWKIAITISINSHSVVFHLQIADSQTGVHILNSAGKCHFSIAHNQTLIRNKAFDARLQNGFCDARRSQLVRRHQNYLLLLF